MVSTDGARRACGSAADPSARDLDPMSAESSIRPEGAAGAAPKRHLRNYLLDPRFQLKYSGYVVMVTLVVASTLGAIAFEQSHAQTEMLSIDLAMQGETSAFIEARAREYDRNMAVAIVCGILALCGALGVTGVLITHRVVGPAYKLKRLFQHVIDGHLRLEGRLRKGDELQDVFEAYERMIETLRERQRAQIGAVEEVIGLSRSSGASAETLARLEQLRQELKVALD